MENINLLLSIIIPIHNSEKYLEQCLNSILILNSKFKYEIICILDNCTDKSSDIIKSFQNKFGSDIIKSFYANNGDPGVTRNVGIKNAKGKYLTFVDSDDTIRENYFDEVYKWLTNYKFNFYNFSFYMIRKENELYKNKLSYIYPTGIFNNKWTFWFLKTDMLMKGFCWKCIYNRDFIIKNNILFPPYKLCIEDISFNAMVLIKNNKKTFLSRKRIYNYRLTNNSSATHMWSDFQMLDKYVAAICFSKYYALSQNIKYSFFTFFLKKIIRDQAKKYKANIIKKYYHEEIRILKNTNNIIGAPWENVINYIDQNYGLNIHKDIYFNKYEKEFNELLNNLNII